MTWTYLLQLSLLASHLVSAHDSGQDNAHGEDGCQPCITDVPHVLEGILSRGNFHVRSFVWEPTMMGTEERLWLIITFPQFPSLSIISQIAARRRVGRRKTASGGEIVWGGCIALPDDNRLYGTRQRLICGLQA